MDDPPHPCGENHSNKKGNYNILLLADSYFTCILCCPQVPADGAVGVGSRLGQLGSTVLGPTHLLFLLPGVHRPSQTSDIPGFYPLPPGGVGQITPSMGW